MTPAEASQVLMLAAALDPRLRPPSEDDAMLRAGSWSAVVLPWVTLEMAMWAVREHYRNSTDGLMPAHVNALCRQARRVKEDREVSKAITALNDTGVPMPDGIKQQIHRLIHRKVP